MNMTQQRYEEMGRGGTCAAEPGRDREAGGVTAEMSRLGYMTDRLDKVTIGLRDRLELVLVNRPSPSDGRDECASPSRCEHASALSSHTDHLESVARRLEDLLTCVDL